MRTGFALLAMMALAALLAPWLLPDPEALDLAARLEPPGSAHLLGTDELGRDIAARLAHGGRISLSVAAITALLSMGLGTVIGLLAGFHGGWIDRGLMRLTDSMMALPLLPLLVVLAAADPVTLGVPPDLAGSSGFAVARLSVIIALVGWTTVARLVRAQAMTLRSRDYVRAARAMGASDARIMNRHILPNLASPILVATTLSVGHIILVESALSFLGLGIRPPMASWGNMLTGAMDVVWSAPLLALWPGLAILTAVLGFNLLGEGLRRGLDPSIGSRR